MTPSLRRAHRTIWLLLAVGLPIGFVAALSAVKPPLMQSPIDQLPPAPLPIRRQSTTTDSLTVTLLQDAPGTQQQIEIVVNQPAEVVTTVEVQEVGNWRALGLLNAPGVYRFALANAHPTIRLIDALHHRTLHTFQL